MPDPTQDDHRVGDAIDVELLAELCDRTLRPSAGQRPVIGIAGSVAVGKSSMAARLAAAYGERGLQAEIVGTDGFLFPNAVLQQRGLITRKGFPETYDETGLAAFVRSARHGAEAVEIPTYSHALFDIDGTRLASLGDVVIVEGVNALQPSVARELGHRLYIETDEETVFGWFASRFRGLVAEADVDERSFYRQFVPLSPEQREELIRQVWDGINAVNLHEHIIHTRPLADIVIHMRADHLIARLETQEQP